MMRWTILAVACVAGLGMVSVLRAAEVGHGCAGCDQYGTSSAPACMAPFPGMKPGCCESRPTACDNAWEGFCQEKAPWRAFWSRLGSGAYCGCKTPTAAALQPRAVSVVSPAPTLSPTLSPTPAVQAELESREVSPRPSPGVQAKVEPHEVSLPLGPAVESDTTMVSEDRMQAERSIPLPPVEKTSQRRNPLRNG